MHWKSTDLAGQRANQISFNEITLKKLVETLPDCPDLNPIEVVRSHVYRFRISCSQPFSHQQPGRVHLREQIHVEL